MLLRAMSSLANAQPLSFLVLILIASITGFSISLLLSVIYRYLINQRPLVTWGVTALILPFAVSLYAFIESWVIGLYRPDSDNGFTQLFLGVFYLDLTLLGAWSALYYAINFFLKVEEQNDQLLRLEAEATAAQLAMLRYQLNPHFLFNTLNSISTLVLLKQTERANAMLARLSSFLRYTLANEPTAQVTLAQEVETLKLYLEIEKMRFEERLRPHFRIEAETIGARLPSLLLQPLVENAIKYAVTPSEDVADIWITACREGAAVRIEVADSGPRGGAGIVSVHSTGVGLANIQDRLTQAYGGAHGFTTRANDRGGFSVIIEIPVESSAKDRS
jgi:LytS/YehU family sensor histidine kinase